MKKAAFAASLVVIALLLSARWATMAVTTPPQDSLQTAPNTSLVNGLSVEEMVHKSDLQAIATHEFGHSIGLAHVLNNQMSSTDGTGATMFPLIDTDDPPAELSVRSLDIDDIAYASYFYPEGTGSSGPAALQAGDVAFTNAFGLITGELRRA